MYSKWSSTGIKKEMILTVSQTFWLAAETDPHILTMVKMLFNEISITKDLTTVQDVAQRQSPRETEGRNLGWIRENKQNVLSN